MSSDVCVQQVSVSSGKQRPSFSLSIIMAFSDAAVLLIETNSLTLYTFHTHLQCSSVCFNTEQMHVRGSRHWSVSHWEFLSKIYISRKREKQKEEIKIKTLSVEQWLRTNFCLKNKIEVFRSHISKGCCYHAVLWLMWWKIGETSSFSISYPAFKFVDLDCHTHGKPDAISLRPQAECRYKSTLHYCSRAPRIF